jgi:CRISPR-associated protein Csm4
MQIELWNISGRSFHFGRHGMGQEESAETLTSDSLFAALVARLAALRGGAVVDAWTRPFLADQPPFALSSAFPRAGGVRFYPAPLSLKNSAANLDGVDMKSIKKVRFLSEALFRRVINGEALDTPLYKVSIKLNEGRLLCAVEDAPHLPTVLRKDGAQMWTVEQRPRVTIQRDTNQSNLYFTGQTLFAKDCGLWFGVRWLSEDPALRADLAGLLEDLGDAGLGGERSCGFGAASIQPAGKVELPNTPRQPWVTLSRYLPRPDEISALQSEQAAYTLEKVGGWAQSPGKKAERRRAVNMLSEGSVFGGLPRAVPGRVVDTQPDYNGSQPLGHPVWRSGLALAVSLNDEGR